MTLTTAGLMGLDVPAAALHLVMAERALPPAAIRNLEHTPALVQPARPYRVDEPLAAAGGRRCPASPRLQPFPGRSLGVGRPEIVQAPRLRSNSGIRTRQSRVFPAETRSL
ncbi:hypothetical protein [Embleya sp. NPDC059237]|uniref:hypothetical protein n=1 Tax=Embleya sp. NPDC059237 TaxID=3346784 RepID=UPI0036C0EF77